MFASSIRRSAAVVVLVGALAAAGCGSSPTSPTPAGPTGPSVHVDPIPQMVSQVSTPSVMATIQHLESFGTRYFPTPTLEAAGDYLYDEFAALGLAVERDPFTYAGYGTNNIVATLAGATDPQTVLVVGAHYDSRSDNPFVLAPGADDNASGVAVVLELARVLRHYQFDITIKFIAFSAEEGKLLGSTHYASSARNVTHEKILGMVNFDMVGYVDQAPEDLDLVFDRTSEWLANAYRDAASRYAPLPMLKVVRAGGLADDRAFSSVGYSALCVIDDHTGPEGQTSANPHWHKTHDTSDTLNLAFLDSVLKASVAAVAELAQPVSNLASPANLVGSSHIVQPAPASPDRLAGVEPVVQPGGRSRPTARTRRSSARW